MNGGIFFMADTSFDVKIQELCRNPHMKELFKYILDTVSGHDHDGTNSKSVGNGYTTLTGVETLTNKTITSPLLTTPKINDGATHVSITSENQTHAAPTVTIPDVGDAADTFVMLGIA